MKLVYVLATLKSLLGPVKIFIFWTETLPPNSRKETLPAPKQQVHERAKQDQAAIH